MRVLLTNLWWQVRRWTTGMECYLTELKSYPVVGPTIWAYSWEDAERKAAKLDIRLVGIFGGSRDL